MRFPMPTFPISSMSGCGVALAWTHPELFTNATVPKDEEIVVDRPHELSNSTHDIAFYERELTKAFAEGRRLLQPDWHRHRSFSPARRPRVGKQFSKLSLTRVGLLPALGQSTPRWKLALPRKAKPRLASSVHLVCRPRENPDGSVRTDEIGDWRDVLAELPRRIHEWMPRLAEEGVVGADAIFACLGPALEVFSRYCRVEKASGEAVPLSEYLEHVWAAVSNEALTMIFTDADAAGFEPDARLTAMWLWTLGASPSASGNGNEHPTTLRTTAEEEDDRGRY